MLFVGLFPEKQLVITQNQTESEYYINGESDCFRFGVVGDGNLFEPGQEIKVVIECLDEYSANGKKAQVYYSLGKKTELPHPKAITRPSICTAMKSQSAES